MAKITYTNKVALNENPEIALINKVTDDDLNEIKSVVNTNDDNVGDLTNLTTTNKTNIVAAINEVNSGKASGTDLGNIANLTTTDKTSAVNAINELNSDKAPDDIILVQSSEPTSDSNILWINDGQIGTPASEITNSYSESTGIGYSANYVNNLKNYQDYTSDLSTIGVTGNVSCESQFGICCFTMGLRSSSGDIAAYTKIVDGVPKPKYALNFNAVNGFGEAIRMQIGTDGAVYVANVMSSSNNYLGTISYVIDEENN